MNCPLILTKGPRDGRLSSSLSCRRTREGNQLRGETPPSYKLIHNSKRAEAHPARDQFHNSAYRDQLMDQLHNSYYRDQDQNATHPLYHLSTATPMACPQCQFMILAPCRPRPSSLSTWPTSLQRLACRRTTPLSSYPTSSSSSGSSIDWAVPLLGVFGKNTTRN